MTNLDIVLTRQYIKKQRRPFADKGLYSQSYGFSCSHVRMWELDHREGWALKDWFFQIVLLEKTLENPLDCSEIQPVHLEGNHPEYSLEGRMLKLQSFGHLIQRADSLEKTLMLAKIECNRRRKRQRMKWLDSISDSMDLSLSILLEIVKDREVRRAAVHGGHKTLDMT